MHKFFSNFILLALATGLWANAAALMLHAAPAVAQTEPALTTIAEDIHLIAQGRCHSNKLC